MVETLILGAVGGVLLTIGGAIALFKQTLEAGPTFWWPFLGLCALCGLLEKYCPDILNLLKDLLKILAFVVLLYLLYKNWPG